MIIYKIQKNGEATDFQFSLVCPDGCKSFDGDTIPDNTEQYHEKKYLDKRALDDQEKELLELISTNEYHLISRRFTKDKEAWEKVLDKWAGQVETVKKGELVKIAKKPF